jgi:hypothetical protein
LSVEIIERHPVLEDVLGTWAEALGNARAGYSGHAYRVFNIARRVIGTDDNNDALAIAAAFHDLGIWSDKTFDYLAPSSARAQTHIEAEKSGISADLVAELIENHHRLRRVRNSAVVEAFRQADLVDVTAGLYRAGVGREFLRELTTAFPYSGFHGILIKTALAWFVRHPLRPFPMLRF